MVMAARSWLVKNHRCIACGYQEKITRQLSPYFLLWILTVSDDSPLRVRITIYGLFQGLVSRIFRVWFERLTEGFPSINSV